MSSVGGTADYPKALQLLVIQHSTGTSSQQAMLVLPLGSFVSKKMLIVRELSLDMEIFLAYVHSQSGLKRETRQYLKQIRAIDPRRRSRMLLGPPPSQVVSRGKADRIRPVKPQDPSRMGAVAP
jgi:hypothetical protein